MAMDMGTDMDTDMELMVPMVPMVFMKKLTLKKNQSLKKINPNASYP